MKHMYFDRDGEPLGLMEWASLCENAEYKRVAWDELPGGGYVSTVWMGINHGPGVGPPVIFETMAFPTERYGIQERYCSLNEALAGHARIARALASGSPATKP